MSEIRITVRATIRGHAPDLAAYAKHLALDVTTALQNENGPDVDVIEVQIERKLEGYEKLDLATK